MREEADEGVEDIHQGVIVMTAHVNRVRAQGKGGGWGSWIINPGRAKGLFGLEYQME